MKLVKIEKANCPACNMVEDKLKDIGATYEKWDIFSTGEDGDKADNTLRELGLITVPVTVVFDEEDKIVAHSAGFNPDELEVLVEKTN